MRYTSLFLFLLLLNACSNDNSQEKIKNLSGYWNIDTVLKPDGTEKEFPFTNHLDFFDVVGNRGTKSRVSPTYDGTFISYGDPITFEWVDKENQVLLNFRSGDKAYTQILKTATLDEMELVHEDGTIYRYKAYVPNEK